MKSNETLQKDVQDAIKFEPSLNAAEIGVIAKDGIVTLTGTVNSYAKKIEAEEAAKRTVGVKAIVEKIYVDFGQEKQNSDIEIASNVLKVLKWNFEITPNAVKVKVEEGWVTLFGELTWNFQKEAAKHSVQKLKGIKGIVNNITLKTDKTDFIEKKDIERAIANNWMIKDRTIGITVSSNKVKLTGIVYSIYERNEAERLAWNAGGVWAVDNELIVEYY